MTTLPRLGIPAAAALGALWLAVGLIAEGTTFHIAPVIVAGAAPMTAWDSPGAAAVAFAVGLLLLVAGRLDGPSLLPWGDASLESALGTVFGAAAGLLLAAAGSSTAHDRSAPR